MSSVSSEAELYFNKDEDGERFYSIFFMMCRKYNVNWSSATDKEKAFIEEATRAMYKQKSDS